MTAPPTSSTLHQASRVDCACDRHDLGVVPIVINREGGASGGVPSHFALPGRAWVRGHMTTLPTCGHKATHGLKSLTPMGKFMVRADIHTRLKRHHMVTVAPKSLTQKGKFNCVDISTVAADAKFSWGHMSATGGGAS